MKTHHAADSSPFRQERYASSPALEKGLNGVLVASRCATLSDPREIELVWFIQWQSMQQGGLEKFAADLLAAFPERLGTPAMLKIGAKPEAIYNAEQVRAVRDGEYPIFDRFDFPLRGESKYTSAHFLDGGCPHREKQCREESRKFPISYAAADFLKICRRIFLKNILRCLSQLCLDPAFSPSQHCIIEEDGYSGRVPAPIFHDLHGALLEYMDRWEKQQLVKIAETAIGKTMLDAMNYSEAERAMVLIEGVYGTGKTFPSKAWCEARPGKRRYIQCPSSNDALDFFRTIAEPIGVSNALSRGTGQLRPRINDVLQAGYFSLVLDESHYLWPGGSGRVATPGRITWVMTALVNYGVPVVLVATPQFTASQVRVEKNSGWQGGQFVGRVSRYINLPEELEEADLRAIARTHLPTGDEKSISALVLYATASKKRLRGIEHGVKAARHVARCAGREQVTFADIKQAMRENVMPSDSALNAALSTATAPAAGRRNRPGKMYATPLQRPLETVSVPVPERDSGAVLSVSPGRAMRPKVASLSTA